MKTNDDHIEKMAEEALNSFDGAGRAAAKPFLYTRLRARMDRGKEGSWEKAVKFIARPVVALAGLCVVICINALVIANSSPSSNNGNDQLATADEFTTSAATLYYAENTEP